MATGYAKATGRLGVCCATSGPAPSTCSTASTTPSSTTCRCWRITGMQETSVLGTRYQQEVHLDRLYQDVAAYNLMVTNPQQLPGVVDLAIRNALAKRTVAHLTFPNDIQVAPVDEDPYRHVGPGGAAASAADAEPAAAPAADARPARAPPTCSTPATKVAMLVGIGARHARDEVLAVADRLGSPIVKTLPGKMVVPDDHPLTTGGLGLLGTRPSEELMEECDTLLMVGTSFPYSTAPARARDRSAWCRSTPTRRSSGCGCRPRPRSSPTPGSRWPALLPLLDPQDGPVLPREVPAARWTAWRERHGRARGRRPRPDRPAVPDARRRRRGRRRRRPDLRLRHDRHVGGPALDDPRRPRVLPVRQPRDDGARACRTPSASSTPTPAGRSSRSSATAGSPC